MTPFVRAVGVLLIALALPVSAQSIAIRSVIDSNITAPGSSFVPGETVVIDINNFAPLQPLTILVGLCGAVPCAPYAFNHPLIEGTLAVNPATWVPIPFWDGIGINGGGPFVPALRADGAGHLLVNATIPASFAALLPAHLKFQVIGLQPPVGAAIYQLSNPLDLTVDEPPPVAAITQITPHVFVEGAPVTIDISGPAITRAPVLPQIIVSAFSPCSGPVSSLASNVVIVTTPGGPVLRCTVPSTIGSGTSGITSPAGPLRVLVDYGPTGVYPNSVTGFSTHTTPAPEGTPTFFAMQTPTSPTVSSISPKGGPIGGGNVIHLTGTHFLDCATVAFVPTVGPEVLSPSVNVLSATDMNVLVPAGVAGIASVIVRGPDHLVASPRESAIAAPTTDYVYFTYSPGSVVVTSVTPPVHAEGPGPFNGTVNGTCPNIGGYNLLDPAITTTSLRLGSIVLGSVADVPLPPATLSFPAPGQFSFAATFPGFPPGLNPLGPSGFGGPGRTNTGNKHVQVVLSPAFGGAHRDYATIESGEPGNVLLYTGPTPVIFGIEPNNVGRVDGGQTIDVKGANFFTQATSFGAATALTTTMVALGGSIALTPLNFVSMVDSGTLRFTTVDLTASVPSLPYTVDSIAMNVDGQMSSTPATNTEGGTIDGDPSNDFVLYSGFAGAVANTFSLSGSDVLVDTSPGGTPQVFTFLGNTVIPPGFTVRAHGLAPLIIRCRGDLTINGTIDLNGASLLPGGGAPAGAGAGGVPLTSINVGSQSSTLGLGGTAAIDPFTLMEYLAAAGHGGNHETLAGGGGGGGMSTNGSAGFGMASTAGVAGQAYPFGAGTLPFPSLTGPLPFTIYLPPGGAGGGAGGIGTALPFDPSMPPPFISFGLNGAGGHGGGGVFIACDGVLTVNGMIKTDGGTGGTGQVSGSSGYSGGGGGGGSGGGLGLAALQGIRIHPGALLTALGGTGGPGGTAPTNSGGDGASGIIRVAIPSSSSNPLLVRQIAGTVNPVAQTTDF